MLWAISNTIESISSLNGDAAQDPNDLRDYTFDTTYSSNTMSIAFIVTATTTAGNETYFAIAGHNLGTIGASFYIYNRGVQVYSSPAPLDDRPIMIELEPESGGNNEIYINIIKQNNNDIATISHISIGHTTDFTSVTTHGQEIAKSYQSGMGLAAMNVARKSKVTLNDRAAPTGTLIKTVSTNLTLKLDNVARNFAQNELVTYQQFWVENAFFIQFDGDETQTIMAMNFVPSAPKAHASTRELVNLSYKFQAYNGL